MSTFYEKDRSRHPSNTTSEELKPCCSLHAHSTTAVRSHRQSLCCSNFRTCYSYLNCGHFSSHPSTCTSDATVISISFYKRRGICMLHSRS